MKCKALVSLLLVYTLQFVSLGQGGADQRASRIERGLLPEALIKGDAVGWSLEERMRHYKAPAVSVAVFQDFKVEWARAVCRNTSERRRRSTPASFTANDARYLQS